jgi:biotin carboxyl carrier protein
MKKQTIHETLQIIPAGRKYKTKLTEKYKNRKIWKKPDPGEIYSVIPCTISALHVHEGMDIKKGDTIMEFEAMKMKNVLVSPFSGKVEKIFANEGDKLAKGVQMLYIKIDRSGDKEEPISISPDLI